MNGRLAWSVRDIPGPSGRLEARLDEPTGPPRAAVVLAHPHPQQGGTMHTKVVYRMAKTLQGIGCVVLRFNFRGVGLSEGKFDDGRGEADDFRAALDWVEQRHPELAIWAAGFSFGAWIALTVGSDDDRVSLLLAVAPPTHRNLDAVRKSTKPKFIIHGEFDELVPLRSVQTLYAQLLEPKELIVIETASHLFDGKVLHVGEAIDDLLGDFTP